MVHCKDAPEGYVEFEECLKREGDEDGPSFGLHEGLDDRAENLGGKM